MTTQTIPQVDEPQVSNLEESLGFIPSSDYLTLHEEYPWLVEGLIPKEGLVNLYGKPKLGKSFAALGIGCAIGDPRIDMWNGQKVHEHGIVGYFQMDTPRSLWIDRLKALKEAGYTLDNIMWADRQKAPRNWDITIPSHAEWLGEQIQRINPKVMFLDVFREMFNGDENESTLVKKVVQNLVEACTGSAIVFISHARKSGQRSSWQQQQDEEESEDITDGNRGSNYLAGRMDSIIRLTTSKMLVKTRAGDMKMSYVQDDVGMIRRLVETDGELDDLVETICRSFPVSESQHIELVTSIAAGMPDKCAYKVRQWHRRRQQEGS